MAFPLALLGVLGYAYLATCFQLLTSPGRPLEFKYESKGGPLSLRVESFIYTPETGALLARTATLRDPAGIVIGSFERLNATGLQIFTFGREPILVSARNAFAKLELKPDGRPKILDYLPEPSDEPSTLPFSVLVENLALDVETTDGNLTRVRTARATVDGLGSSWIASGLPLNLEGGGSIDAWARQSDARGLELLAEVKDAGIAKFLKFFASTPEGRKLAAVKNFGAGDLVGSGDFWLRIRPSQSAVLIGNVQLSGTDVSYGRQYHAEEASFVGSVTTAGAQGLLTAQEGATSGKFTGAVVWDKETALAGRLSLEAPSPSALPAWAREQLPKALSFTKGSFDGWLAYEAGSGFTADGRVESALAKYTDALVKNIALDIHATGKSVLARIENADWDGQQVSGFGSFNPQSQEISAALEGKNVPIQSLGPTFGYDNLRGVADLKLLVRGNASRPRVSLRASGWAEALLEKGKRAVRLGNFNLSASDLAGPSHLGRLTIDGPNGRLVAKGTVNSETKALALDAFSSGIPLRRINADLAGTLAVAARIEGTLSKPTVTGRAEAFNARYQDQEIAAAVADIDLVGDILTASNVQAVVGAFPASGRLAVNLKTRGLSGSASATAFLSDYIAEASGAVALKIHQISGTIDKPVAQATVTSDKAFYAGLDFEDIAANAEMRGNNISLRGLTARAGGGLVTGTGSYDIEKKSGSIVASAENLPLDRLTAQFNDIAKVEGLLDAKSILVSLGKGGVTAVKADGELRQVEINDALFDSGPWEVRQAGTEWSGRLRLGVLERFIQVPRISYDTQSKLLSGEFLTYDLDIKPLISAAIPYVQEPAPDQKLKPLAKFSPKTIDELRKLDGVMSAAIKVSGKTDNLTISEGILEASRLKHGEEAMGQLSANFTRADKAWDIGLFTLTGGPLAVTAKGTIEEDGDTRLDGELNLLNVHWLANFDPDLSPLYGSAALPFLIDGPTERPNVQGSLDLRLLDAPLATKPVQEELLSAVFPFTLISQGVNDYTLEGKGKMNYKVFTGDLSATVPLDGLFALSPTQPWKASLVSGDRDISREEIAAQLPALDPQRTNLSASGAIHAEGIKGKATFTGDLTLRKSPNAPPDSAAIALVGAETHLLDLTARALLNEDILRVTLAGKGSHSPAGSTGDNLEGSIEARLGSVEELLSSLVSGSIDRLFDVPLQGQLTANAFGFRETNLVPNSAGVKGAAAASITGMVLVDQTLGRPRLRTADGKPILVSQGDFVLPTIPEPETLGQTPRIVPSFDVDIALQDPARLRAGNATLTVTGSGALNGTLLLPDVEARMSVLDGVLRLPTSRVRVQEGGTMHLQYRDRPGDIDAFSRLDVNLHGKTNLTALRFGDVVERYDIDLFITGDLLSDQPININAQSTPGDLSSQQIIRLLGQADLLESLTASVKTSLGDQTLREALSTFAVPALFDPFTEEVARNLGLDYLAIEYNALEQTTITAAKNLGKGLSLQFRRQLFEPAAGELQRFDLRMTYRIPSRNVLLSRLTLNFGRDQDRPWKIGLEYSSRF